MESNKFPAIEQQVFEWEEWGETEAPGSLEFGNVTLKVDVGEHKAGTKFDGAFLSSSTGTVSFKNFGNKEVFTYRLLVTPGERVNEEEVFGEGATSGVCGCGKDHCQN